MKLSPWAWLISGLIVAIFSAVIYFTIPKNGEPNAAMALFFFIGVIFIVVGVSDLFFKRNDTKEVFASVDRMPVNTNQQQNIQNQRMPINVSNMQMQKQSSFEQNNQVIGTQNRVEQEVMQLALQEQTKVKPTVTQNTSSPIASLHEKYKYNGPVYTSHSKHTTAHNTAHHISSVATHSTHATQSHSVSGIKCRGCGNVNAAHANYCHTCGHRLK